MIPSILAKEPLITQELHEKIKNAIPECINDKRCNNGYHGAERNDYEWQHSVRRAQNYLKEKGRIGSLKFIWYIPKNPRSRDVAEEMEAELHYEKNNHTKLREDLKSLDTKATEYEEINGIRIKRDNATVAKLKILREFKCQICGTRIEKKDGKYYAEGALYKAYERWLPGNT